VRAEVGGGRGWRRPRLAAAEVLVIPQGRALGGRAASTSRGGCGRSRGRARPGHRQRTLSCGVRVMNLPCATTCASRASGRHTSSITHRRGRLTSCRALGCSMCLTLRTWEPLEGYFCPLGCLEKSATILVVPPLIRPVARRSCCSDRFEGLMLSIKVIYGPERGILRPQAGPPPIFRLNVRIVRETEEVVRDSRGAICRRLHEPVRRLRAQR
jgi:hypothetical protein